MADTKLLAYLEEFITEDRKAKFLEISLVEQIISLLLLKMYTRHTIQVLLFVAVRCLEYNRPTLLKNVLENDWMQT